VVKSLQFLEELAARARNEDPSTHIAFTVFNALYDAGGLAALGTIGALGGIHHFLAISGLGYLGHGFDLLLFDGSRGLMAPGSAVWEIQRRESDASHAETATP
jgi:hypothetical protein